MTITFTVSAEPDGPPLPEKLSLSWSNIDYMEFRNIAIIAHVDHGKTTLVDAFLRQGGVFRDNQEIEERAMDSNALERERGITIYAKNTAVKYKNSKINIVDTPGHADFGSEVERILRTIDSVLLVVDAYEGPMPQTKFVLKKSLELGLNPIVVVNKIDKPTARPDDVINKVFDLFVALGASSEQLDFPIIYTIAREGIAKKELSDDSKDLTPLFEMIMEKVPKARTNIEAPLRMQPANLGYDNYLGRLAIGRLFEGTAEAGMNVWIKTPDGEKRKGKISKVFTYEGLQRIEVPSVTAGDIVCIAGIPDIFVGETIAADENAKPLPAISVDPPTLKMDFLINNSPFSGTEGKLVTSRQIRARLEKELETNVGLHVDSDPTSDCFHVSGRGELHLSILIETMRREGFELQVSQPQVIMKEDHGKKFEPIEQAVIDVPDSMVGIVIESMGKRKGEMENMSSENGMTRLEFMIPTRGLLGFRSAFILETRGQGILSHNFVEYGPYKGEIEKRTTGSIISGFTGKTLAFALWNLQERGILFIHPATEVYEGMIIGEASKSSDLTVNPTKGKKLTNMRSSGADDAIRLTPPVDMTLEKALEYIADDELVEVTPLNIRIRKKFLTENDRKRNPK